MLNVGVRYRHFSVPKEESGRLFNRTKPFGFGPFINPDSILCTSTRGSRIVQFNARLRVGVPRNTASDVWDGSAWAENFSAGGAEPPCELKLALLREVPLE